MPVNAQGGANGFIGGMYWDPATGKLQYETDQRITQDQYQQILDWQKRRSMGGNFENLEQLAQKTGMTPAQIQAANDYYQMQQYSENPGSAINNQLDWNNTYQNKLPQGATGYGGLFDSSASTGNLPTAQSIYGGPAGRQRPTSNSTLANILSRPAQTRLAATQSPVASTRGQAPELAVDPGINAGNSTSPAYPRIMTSPTENSASSPSRLASILAGRGNSPRVTDGDTALARSRSSAYGNAGLSGILRRYR